MTTPILDLDLPPDHPLRQILDTIAAHPEVREPVLRVLLTEDFLELPVQVRELRADLTDFKGETRDQFRVANERLDENTRRLDGIDGRLDGIDGRLDGIDGRLDGIDGRLDGIDGRLDGIDGRLDETIQVTRSIRGAVGALRGDSYEDLCRKEIGVILDGWINRPVLADREQIGSLLRHARWRNEISRDEYLDGLRPDVIAHETVGKSKPAHYAIVEASITFNRRDLENASRRAAIIARVTGAKTDAFVATHSADWPEVVGHAAQSLGVTIIRHEAPEYSEA